MAICQTLFQVPGYLPRVVVVDQGHVGDDLGVAKVLVWLRRGGGKSEVDVCLKHLDMTFIFEIFNILQLLNAERFWVVRVPRRGPFPFLHLGCRAFLHPDCPLWSRRQI